MLATKNLPLSGGIGGEVKTQIRINVFHSLIISRDAFAPHQWK